MPYPSEAWPATATIEALNGTTDSKTGINYIPNGAGPATSPPLTVQEDRLLNRLRDILDIVTDLRFRRESIPGLTYGVNPGSYTLGGTHKTYSGATGQTLTNNATNYIYLNSSNALTVSTSSFPADKTSYMPIAEVVCSGGDVTSVTDRRSTALFVIPTATSTSDTGTNEASYIIDEDNAGAAAAELSVRMNRGSSDAEDAALTWVEASSRFELRSKHSTGTLTKLNASEIQISGSTALDSNGAAKVQSAVAGSGLGHSSGVLSVNTSSAAGTSLSGDNVAVDPSDGITLDANGVAVNLASDPALEFTGSSGSGQLRFKPDDATIERSSGGARVKDGGLAPVKAAEYTAAAGGIDFIFSATLSGGNTVAIFSADAPFKFRVLDAWSIAKSADGGTWKVDDGTNAITDTVTVTGTDKTINRATQIDDTYHEISASGSLRVVGDGANADVTVYVRCMRVS